MPNSLTTAQLVALLGALHPLLRAPSVADALHALGVDSRTRFESFIFANEEALHDVYGRVETRIPKLHLAVLRRARGEKKAAMADAAG